MDLPSIGFGHGQEAEVRGERILRAPTHSPGIARLLPHELGENLGYEGLIDDGAVIYINGVESARINLADTKDATLWNVYADGSNHAPGNVNNEAEQT